MAWLLQPLYEGIYYLVESHARFAPKWFGGFDGVNPQTMCANLLGTSVDYVTDRLCDDKIRSFMHGRCMVVLSVALGFGLCLLWFYLLPFIKFLFTVYYERGLKADKKIKQEAATLQRKKTLAEKEAVYTFASLICSILSNPNIKSEDAVDTMYRSMTKLPSAVQKRLTGECFQDDINEENVDIVSNSSPSMNTRQKAIKSN